MKKVKRIIWTEQERKIVLYRLVAELPKPRQGAQRTHTSQALRAAQGVLPKNRQRPTKNLHLFGPLIKEAWELIRSGGEHPSEADHRNIAPGETIHIPLGEGPSVVEATEINFDDVAELILAVARKLKRT